MNDVFVALALAARTATLQGGDEALDEWRGAAACARRNCKPDGYGVYRRGGARFGFIVEFDRGTERLDEYTAKFEPYYVYRYSGEAERDYDGFPTLLCISTEGRGRRSWLKQPSGCGTGGVASPIPILLPTSQQIRDHPEGIPGPIWRTPAVARGCDVVRQYWLPGGSPRGLFGAARRAPPISRFQWMTLTEV